MHACIYIYIYDTEENPKQGFFELVKFWSIEIWSIERLIYWAIVLLCYWSIVLLVYWAIDLLSYWAMELWSYWSIGLLVYWAIDLLSYWSIELLIYWAQWAQKLIHSHFWALDERKSWYTRTFELAMSAGHRAPGHPGTGHRAPGTRAPGHRAPGTRAPGTGHRGHRASSRFWATQLTSSLSISSRTLQALACFGNIYSFNEVMTFYIHVNT